jgi:phosphoribosylformylglycinamidine synthase subunit PurL
VRRLGTTGGDSLTVEGADAISTAELRRINEAWLPAYMAAP